MILGTLFGKQPPMKTFIFGLSLLAMTASGLVRAEADCVGDNTHPMFGYNRHHINNSCDIQFLMSVLKGAKGDKKVALQGVLELGWRAYTDQNYDIAIKRFNQAWLIDRKSYEVYWGFGGWEKAMGNLLKAEDFMAEAYKLNPKDSKLIFNYAGVVVDNALVTKDKKKVMEAITLLEKSVKLDPHFPEATQLLTQAKATLSSLKAEQK